MDERTKAQVLRVLEGLMWVVAVVGLGAVLAQVGAHVPAQYTEGLRAVAWVLLGCFIAEQALRLALSSNRRQALGLQLFDLVLIAVFLPASAALGERSGPGSWLIWFWLSGHLLHRAVMLQRVLARARFRPAHILVGSYLLIITAGIVLLYSPRATAAGTFPRFEDAVFTATSAVCVTGLIVQDTGRYWSPFGQMVILVLIQIGGLGLMTFGAFFSLVLARGMRLREQLLMRDVLSYDVVGRIARTVVLILLVTAGAELVGAGLLFLSLDGTGSLGERLYLSIFHSISAFCNAGFSLFSTSMQHYVNNLGVNLTMTALIVVGGLGFVVHQNLLDLLRAWVRRRLRPPRLLQAGEVVGRGGDDKTEPEVPPTMLLQTKLVLVVTAALLVGGFLAFLALEWNHGFGGLAPRGRLLAAWFQSVTTRTAGFNTVPTERLTPASQFLSIVLMFIGASPGSTGGGIKTTTFAMLLLAVVAIIRNREGVESFGRTIPGDIINKAITVVILGTFVVTAATVALLVTESAQGWSFLEVLFEVMSAFGTVGLSLGITPKLTAAAKVMLCLVMLVGRIGPLTLVLSISQQGPKPAYEYPRGTVMVG